MDAEAWRNAAYWLAPPGLLGFLSYTPQDHLLRDSTLHSRWGSCISIINHYTLIGLPTGQSYGASSQLRALLPRLFQHGSGWQKPRQGGNKAWGIFLGSETVLFDVVMMQARHWTFIKTHRMYDKGNPMQKLWAVVSSSGLISAHQLELAFYIKARH